MSELGDMKLDSELKRWTPVAQEWLSDENRKFGESLKHLVTYLVAGNIAGVLAVVKIVSETATRSLVTIPVKVALIAFSIGALAGVAAGLALVFSQWRCVNLYRKRIVDLYKGSIDIDKFSAAPNFYILPIAILQILAIVAFVVGGTGISLWVYRI